MSTDTIGTLGTHIDIETWENQLDFTSAPEIGECLAEEFLETVLIDGNTPSDANYGKLTSQNGAEHDGRSHDVSSASNARIVSTDNQHVVRLFDEYTELSWLELDGPGNRSKHGLIIDFVGAGWLRVHHNVIHNDQASSATTSNGIRCNDTDGENHVYRNIIYGYGVAGIWMDDGAAGSECYYNTVFECNFFSAATVGGIDCDSGNATLKYNAAFDNDLGTENDIITTTGTWGDNATEDGTGDFVATEGRTAFQFENPTTTWANTDLRIKAGADLIDIGTPVATTNNPEINVPITARGTTITGDWDIGADERAGAPPSGMLNSFGSMRGGISSGRYGVPMSGGMRG